MITFWDLRAVGQQLDTGRLACPRCGHHRWRRHGYAPTRRVRREGSDQQVTPPRVRCLGCQTTQVILPAWVVPRRADAIEVIGTALAAKARGTGHRRIAVALGRPAATARGWLRAAATTAGALREHAAVQADRFDPAGRHPWPRACPTPLGDAVSQLVHPAIAAAHFLRVPDRTKTTIWALAGLLTAGRLLAMPRPG